MRSPAPLPDDLLLGPVTRAALSEAGFHAERIRRSDLDRAFHGIHLAASAPDSADHQGELLRRAHALALATPQSWVSHTTAAQLRHLWLPRRLAEDRDVHISQPRGTTHRLRRRGARGHRCRISDGDLAQVTLVGSTPVPMSTPARNWVELAAECGEEELIILGDCLVRLPRRRFEGRARSHCGLGDLAAALDRARHLPGRRTALAALDHIRVGSDSPAETRLRLRLVEAGLPEPALQVPAAPWDRFSPTADLAYPEARVAIQYDGATHFIAEQARADQQRDNVFHAEGWIVLRFNRDHHRDSFRRAVRDVAAVLRRRAPQLLG